MKKEGKGLRSDSPPELKEVGVASILELLSVSTLTTASRCHSIFASSSPRLAYRLKLTYRCDRRSNPHPRRPPPHLPQIPKPKPKPSSSHTIQQYPPEIHLRPLIIQTTSPAVTPLHSTYLTLRSTLQRRGTYASGCSSFD
jgi:hypothetical protein